MMNQAALNQYQNVSAHSAMTDASPHRVIAMQFDGALDRVASARGAIQRKELGRKGELLSGAIAIIDSLRASLNHELGGEISVNLASLYDYIELRLVEANMNSDVLLLDEVRSLLKELKLGWASIPAELRQG